MSPARFRDLTARYAELRLALVGDFCLDRYLEIDPARQETSIETGLPVRNVVRVRSQPGGAGTILNNLVALGVRRVDTVGFCGEDGEGYELRRALAALPGVGLDHFLSTPDRRTFTYCKPLLMHPGRPPEELNRLDSKNWTPSPVALQDRILDALRHLRPSAHAVIALDQVDLPDTGVITRRVRDALGDWARAHPSVPVLADSRQGLRDWPPMRFKMNAAELASLLREPAPLSLDDTQAQARALARQNGHPVYITLSEHGVIGALPDGTLDHVPALPVRGPIDIVGAGDAVTANLAAATAAGASLHEALELAMAAAHVVIHQLGTTGTATPDQLREALQIP